MKDKTSILIVDDEEIILLALRESFSDKNYNIVTTSNPIEAIEHLKKESFSVIISDQRMAEMSGLKFFKKCMEIQPNASRVLITGVLTLKTIIDSVNKGEIFRFVAKPWIREELLATIDNAVQRYDLIYENQELYKGAVTLNTQLAETNKRLERKLNEISDQKKEIDTANDAMHENFNHSLNICYRLISAFDPMLGAQTMSAVNIVKLINQTDYFSKEEKQLLITSAWLQKIGLLGINRNLITKANRTPQDLTDEEKTAIRQHPVLAQGLVGFVDDLSVVNNVLRSCYERWDGTGYPDSLVGHNIPKIARILAIIIYYVECDLSSDAAVESISQKGGTFFEQESVDLFLDITRNHSLPRKIKELFPSELMAGMVLAKNLHRLPNTEMCTDGHIIDAELINTLRQHSLKNPDLDPILVYI